MDTAPPVPRYTTVPHFPMGVVVLLGKCLELSLPQELGHTDIGPGAAASAEAPWRMSLTWKESDLTNLAQS